MYYPEKIVEFKIVKRWFNGKEKDCIIVEISGFEYEECVRATWDDAFASNAKPGAYGRGWGSTADDPFKTPRTGMLGQMALGKLTGIPVDTEYRKFGDRQDFMIGNRRVDVKCAMSNYGMVCILHTDEFGKREKINKHIYIASYIEEENRAEKRATIVVVGFAWRKDVLTTCEVKPGKGDWLNYELLYDKCQPIVPFLKFVDKKLVEYELSMA